LVRGADGKEYKPEDYLQAFARFVAENPDHIEAIRILQQSPAEWSTAALAELRNKLRAAPQRFTVENLQKAHEVRDHKALADIISMVKHAADKQNPLLTASERVERAFVAVGSGRTFTSEQQQWLERIKAHLAENLSIDKEDFEVLPVFTRFGGWKKANGIFFGELPQLIHSFNQAIAI
jgi:type I restriction enzyme R subunit